MEEFEYDIWKEFEELATYDVSVIHSNREVKAHYGLKYEDRLTTQSKYGNYAFDKDFMSLDMKIDSFLNMHSDLSSVDWNEMLSIYPKAPINVLDPWQIDWKDKRKKLHSVFFNEEVSFKYIVKKRWKDGVLCPKCFTDEPYIIKASHLSRLNSTNPYIFKCRKCRKFFNPKTDSFMTNSPLPYSTWFGLIYLLTSVHRDSISSRALGRSLKISQKSSWHLIQKIKRNVGDEFLSNVNKGLFEGV